MKRIKLIDMLKYNKLQYFYPWIYPENLQLSSNQKCLKLLNNILYDDDKDEYIMKTSLFNKNLQSFIDIMNSYLNINYMLSKHKLFSIIRIIKDFSHIITYLESTTNTSITWDNTSNNLYFILFNTNIFKYDKYENKYYYLENLFKQTLLSIAKISVYFHSIESCSIICKELYLLEKVRHNKSKKTMRLYQREQISIIPWSVQCYSRCHYYKITKHYENKLKQAKIFHLKFYKGIISQEQYDSLFATFHQIKIKSIIDKTKSNQFNTIKKLHILHSIKSNIEYNINKKNLLWNASKTM